MTDKSVLEKLREDLAKVCDMYAVTHSPVRGKEMAALIRAHPLSSYESAPIAPRCEHKGQINRGYQGGYDLAWCDDCGVITWASDGLISNEEARRSDRHKWCEKRVVAFGCTKEASGEKVCTNWCAQSYCAVSLNEKEKP